MQSEKRIRYIQGPIGSGKTTGAIVEMVRRAQMQRPGPDGVRRFRAVLVRNTMQQLRDTTMKSFFAMFPPGIAGAWRATDKTFTMKFSDVEAEFLFRALDTPDDTRQLLSLELSAGFLEEAREIDEEIFTALNSRLGRYPSAAQGGCPHPFLVMVSNPPVVGGWLWELVENTCPPNFASFFQPPALIPGTREVNPDAENLPYLNDPDKPETWGGYYQAILDGGANNEFINVHLRNQYGSVQGGQAVYREDYEAGTHVAAHALEPIPHQTIYLGTDAGLTPACAIGQVTAHGQLRVLDEIVGKSIGAYRFIQQQVKPLLLEKYSRNTRIVIIDPAARQRAQTDERTVRDIFVNAGFKTLFASTNNPIARVDSVKRMLNRRIALSSRETVPGLLISPTCPTLRTAMAGGYFYAMSTKGVMGASPVKNEYSHISDALQYLSLHAEGKLGLEGSRPQIAANPLSTDANWRSLTM